MAADGWIGRRWIGLGFLAVFLMIGLVAAVAALLRPSGGSGGSFFGWSWGLLGFLFFLWFLTWIARPWYWWGPRRWYRYGWPAPWAWYGQRDGATEILRQRYARGEITRDQFEAMKRDLDAHRPGGAPPANP